MGRQFLDVTLATWHGAFVRGGQPPAAEPGEPAGPLPLENHEPTKGFS